MPQIHQQKGEIVENVDSCDLVVELDAVEQARLAVEKADVAQVKIAMAAAHLARGLAPVEEIGMARKSEAERRIQRTDPARVEHDGWWRSRPC